MPSSSEQVARLQDMRKQLDSWKGQVAAAQARKQSAEESLEKAKAQLEELGITKPEDIAALRQKAERLLDEAEKLINDTEAKQVAIEEGTYDVEQDTTAHGIL